MGSLAKALRASQEVSGYVVLIGAAHIEPYFMHTKSTVRNLQYKHKKLGNICTKQNPLCKWP